MKIMGYVVAPISVLCTLKLAAGLQLYFLISSVLAQLQTWASQNKTMRRLFRLPDRDSTGPRPGSPASKEPVWHAPRTINTTATPATPAKPAAPEPVDAVSNPMDAFKLAREKLNKFVEKKELAKERQEYDRRVRAKEFFDRDALHQRFEEKKRRKKERSSPSQSE